MVFVCGGGCWAGRREEKKGVSSPFNSPLKVDIISGVYSDYNEVLILLLVMSIRFGCFLHVQILMPSKYVFIVY